MSNEPHPNPSAPYAPPVTPYGAPVQQPSQPFSSATGAGERRKGLVIAGIAVLVAGLGGAVAAFLAGDSAYEEGVENLAHAPVGCTTRLDFDEAGTFTIYVETKGSTDDPGGDCPNSGDDFDRGNEDLPEVDLQLVDEDGNEISLEDDGSKTYDAGGATGESIMSVEIERDGRFELTVTSDDDDFAIAIGKNPQEAADTLKLISYALAAVGLLLGGLLIFLGLRRTAPPRGDSGTPSPAMYYPEQQPPAGYAPTGAHTPSAPPPHGGGFGPPSSAPPSDPYPPTPQRPSPQWPAPPGT